MNSRELLLISRSLRIIFGIFLTRIEYSVREIIWKYSICMTKQDFCSSNEPSTNEFGYFWKLRIINELHQFKIYSNVILKFFRAMLSISEHYRLFPSNIEYFRRSPNIPEFKRRHPKNRTVSSHGIKQV